MTRPEPRWLGRLAVDEAHYRQIREHGGAYGLRDESALESALARPRHRWRYEREATVAVLAAAYAFALTKDHPYIGGNKRIALVVMVTFLERNGVGLMATNAEMLSVMLALAAGDMTEDEVVRWIDAHCPAP